MESGEALPEAEQASGFRGSGAIGGHEMPGNRNAATVSKAAPRLAVPTGPPAGRHDGEQGGPKLAATMKRVVREKGAFDLTRRCLIPSRERMSLLSRRKGREFHTYWTENLGPKFLKAFAAGSAGKCGRCRCPDASACRRGTWSRRFRRGGIRPTFSFVLAKENVPRPVQKKTALLRLLVRPVQMGLGSSSCAKRRALPVRSRRSCIAYTKPLVLIGLLSATAPLPLSGQKKNV